MDPRIRIHTKMSWIRNTTILTFEDPDPLTKLNPDPNHSCAQSIPQMNSGRGSVQTRTQTKALLGSMLSVGEFIDPWLGDKVNSGIGLLYRPASLCSLACRCDNLMPELTISSCQGWGIYEIGYCPSVHSCWCFSGRYNLPVRPAAKSVHRCRIKILVWILPNT